EDELRYLLDDADVVAVVFHREFAPKLAAVHASLPKVRTYLAVDDGAPPAPDVLAAEDYETALEGASAERDFGSRSADDLYILYTGGTTGMPKGVMWRNEDVFFGALGCRACCWSTATARRRPADRDSRSWCQAATSRARRSSACRPTRWCSTTNYALRHQASSVASRAAARSRSATTRIPRNPPQP